MILPQRQESSLDQETSQEPPELKLFLRMPQLESSRKPPSKLAQKLGLHLYSEVLLGKSARTEMNLAAILLIIVSLFEWLAWSFLFNAVFNSDILYYGWRTIPAVAVALLFAAAVFWFERQFLTYDEARRAQAKRAAWIRLGFIIAAAIVTAQSLELFFFRVPIQNRIHEEGIRDEAVRALSATLKEGDRRDRLIGGQSNRRVESNTQRQTEIGKKKEDKDSLEAKLSARKGDAAYWAAEAQGRRRAWGNAVRDGLERERLREAEGSYRAAEARRAAASAAARELEVQIGRLKTEIESLTGETNTVGLEIEQLEHSRIADETIRDLRLEAWIDQLKESKPSKEPIEEKWRPPTSVPRELLSSPFWTEVWQYKDPEYDFFEQLHVVLDLVRGRSPRWLKATEPSKKRLEESYGLGSLDQSRKGFQWHLLVAVLACHLIALFIPLLVLTIKTFLMPQALRVYYSSRHQAEAGDPDAWLSLIVDEKVREAERGRIR